MSSTIRSMLSVIPGVSSLASEKNAEGTTNANTTPSAQVSQDEEEAEETLMIDNFDSFTWNLYQYLCILGARVRVVRNDEITREDFPKLRIKNLIVSPGPGHPRTDSGISREAIEYFAGKVPILGVCMGLQCIVDQFGGDISYAGEILHGKTSLVRHDGRGIFKGVPQDILSTRYHSLSAHVKTLPDCLAITCITSDSGIIMGVRHRVHTIESVQYHPESIMSAEGDSIIRNFLKLRGGSWAENPEFGVVDSNSSNPLYKSPSEKASSSAAKPTILERIYAQRQKDVALAKQTAGTRPEDIAELLSLYLSPPQIDVVARMKQRTPALMAEVKRASPSKGDIAPNANAAHQALKYALAGASVISILTEPTWFKGSLLDMRLARQAVDHLPNRPAILRKDFICEEYQISEARLYGADTILLIVAMLKPEVLKSLYEFSLAMDMEPLVEVNNASEMQRALALGAKLIGVNNRNLHDFEVDMETTSRLSNMVSGTGTILCALSGISGPEDVRQYTAQGVGAMLVGEALMRAPDTAEFIKTLLDIPEAPKPAKQPALVKICGIRSVDDALCACEAGADFIGLVFAPKSRRRVELRVAADVVQYIRGSSASPSTSSPGPSELSPSLPWFANAATKIQLNRDETRRPLVVGVFQGQSLDEILHIVNAAQLDLVQLHGSEPLHWPQFIPVPVIRAFHLPPASDASSSKGHTNGASTTSTYDSAKLGGALKEMTRPGLHSFVLFDTVVQSSSKTKLSGGAGVAFDWGVAKTAVDIGETPASSTKLPVILAGGLNSSNVGEAIRQTGAWAVDVSGGVETDGIKDHDKIREFVRAAKQSSSDL